MHILGNTLATDITAPFAPIFNASKVKSTVPAKTEILLPTSLIVSLIAAMSPLLSLTPMIFVCS